MTRIVGIDEVGRGCWAGPVVAGAVLLDAPIAGLRDSKKLSKKQREALNVEMQQKAVAVGLGWVAPAEVDNLGLTEAVRLAMQRALQQITQPYDEVIVDGSYNFLSENPRARAVVRADDTVPAVSAASIAAKVARDRYMAEYAHVAFPDYDFAAHVGYGTQAHRAALQQFGVCKEHRLSYKPIRLILEGA